MRIEQIASQKEPRCGAARRSAGALAGTAVVAALVFAGTHTGAETLTVPSGQPITFHEMLWDRPGGGLIYRFRFIAPEIGQDGREYEDVEADMQFLCESFALPRVANTGPQPRQIVISLSQEEVEFGVTTAEVIQFFEAYSVQNETCILEFF